MKVIIAGSRKITNYKIVQFAMSFLNLDCSEVVSGGAKGPDLLGEKWAKENNLKIKRFEANWKQYGKNAGYLRNKEMAEYGDVLIAFWDRKSKGTQHMMKIAKDKNIPTYLIINDDNGSAIFNRDEEKTWSLISKFNIE